MSNSDYLAHSFSVIALLSALPFGIANAASDGAAWNVRSWGGPGWLGTSSDVPAPIGGLTGVLSIAAGDAHTLIRHRDGTVRAWGSNSSGQLGDGSCVLISTNPVTVSSLNGVTALSAGSEHSLAVKRDGTVWAWGNNWSGQLGDGTNDNSSVPVRVKKLGGVVSVAASGQEPYLNSCHCGRSRA